MTTQIEDPEIAHLDQEIRALSEALDALIGEIEAGNAVDLHGLDTRIAALCRACETLPQEKARPLAAPFEALLDRLDRLASQMQSG